MNRLRRLWRKACACEPGDRRPRALRRLMPLRFGTSAPLTGDQWARIHIAAYH